MNQLLQSLSTLNNALRKLGHHRNETVSEISAFELEPRVLYSASPIDFADTTTPVDINQDLLLSTEGPSTAGGVTWDSADVIRFSDPNLNYGTSTDGTFSKTFDLANFADVGFPISLQDPRVNALHSVQNDVTVGNGANTFDLEVGDLIFTVEESHTFTGNTTTVTGDDNDVYVFRSDVLADYSSGEFFKLFDDPFQNRSIDGISLVDKAGGVALPNGSVLPQGTFLYSLFASNEIGTFVASSAGPGGTAIANAPVFINGGNSNFEIEQNVSGLHFVQTPFSTGGLQLQEGDILIAVQNDSDVGENETGIKPEDIARLRINSSFSSASAIKFFDGSKVNLDSDNEKIEAITFGVADFAPRNGSISESTIDENIDTSSGVIIGTLTSDDDSPGNVSYQVVGSSPFSVTSGDQLTLTGVILDFETTPSFNVTIRATDSAGLSSVGDVTITVNDVNEAPVLTLQNQLASIDENSNNSSRIKVSDIVVDDDTLGTGTVSLTGADASLFEIIGNELFLRANTSLDHETRDSYSATVLVDDVTIGSTFEDSAVYTLNVADINEAPTVQLINRVTRIDENTAARTRVADIVINDDEIGSESLSLSGADASLFEIVGNQLFLRANSNIDFEVDTTLSVQIRVDDPAIGSSFEDSVDANISVEDVNEAPVVASPLGTRNVIEDASAIGIDLSGTFSDVDFDPLTFFVGTASNPSLASASLTGSTLSIEFFANQSGSVSIPVTASDGEFSVSDTITVNVSPVNDAPLLSGDASLQDIYRDQVPAGESISSYVPGLVNDVDFGDSVSGIAIVSNSASASEGLWQYFDAATNQWRDVGAASSTLAVALSITTDIRFFPASGYSGIPQPLEFVAIDSTYAGNFSQTAQVRIDASVRGNDSPFSVDTGELGINVKPFGISVTPITAMSINESGGSATFEVVLDGEPTGDVTISVASSDTTEGTVSTNQLQFDASNWSTPQQVQIFSVDDQIDDGDQSFVIQLGPAASSDPILNGLVMDDVPIVTIDDDKAGIEISKTQIFTSDDGDSDEFSVRLQSQPLANVVLFVDNSRTDEAVVSASQLVFTPNDWNVAQTVFVTGINDGAANGTQTFKLALRPSSTDANFDGLGPYAIEVESRNAEFPGPILIPATPTETETEDNSDDGDEAETVLANVAINKIRQGGIGEGVDVAANKPWAMDDVSSSRGMKRTVDNAYQPASFELESQNTSLYFSRRTASDSSGIADANVGRAFETQMNYDQLWSNLDELSDRIENEGAQPIVSAGAVASVASVFTAGYLAWLIRGGHLLLGLLSQLPAWSNLDLLTVLSVSDTAGEGESQSLESLVSEDNNDLSAENETPELKPRKIASPLKV